MPIFNKSNRAIAVLLLTSMVLSTMISAQSVYLEDFDLSAGTTVDNGSTAWSRDISNANLGGQGFFEVRSDNGSLIFQGADLDGEAVWLSEIMNISSFTTVTASVSIAEQGRMEGSDYIRLYYVVDGGPETLFGDFTNDFGSTFQTVTTPSIIGSNLQIIIRVRNNRVDEVHAFDDVLITGSTSEISSYLEDFDLPTGTIVDNGPTAWSRDISNANLGGQGFFEVRSDNGSLIFGGADLDGEAVWLSEIVDISSFTTTTASVAIAEQGRMEGSDYIRLYYVVDGGPETLFGDFSDDFGSAFQTVTSPSIIGSSLQVIIRVNNDRTNEVHTFDDVFINGSTSEISTYIEDFDLPTGTIVDNGPTAWSRDISDANLGGQGYFEVRSDNGSLLFQGADLDGEAVWLSEVVDISSFVAATASVSIAEQGRMERSDYIRLYYVVDGGPETLFGDFSNDFGSTFQTVNTPSINGSNLQIVIRVANNRVDERHIFDNVMIIGSSPSGTTLYARQNANWDNYGAWSITALSGSSCSCIPDATTDVIIGDGYSINLDGDADVRNITILDTGTLQWNSAYDLNIRYNGNVIVHNNGNMDNNGLGGTVLNVAETDNNTFSLQVDGNLSVDQINVKGANSILNILDGSGSIVVENSLSLFADDVLVNNNHKGTFTIQNDIILGGDNSSFVNNETMHVGGNLSYNQPLGAVNSNISFSNIGILTVSNDIQSSEAGSQFTNGPSALLNVNNIQTFLNTGITLNNAGTIDMTGDILTVDALSSFINGTGGIWNYQGSTPDPDTRLFTGASNNSFNYNGDNQPIIIPQDHYWHLNLLGTGTKNSLANLDINGDLIISGSCQLDIASGLHDMAIAGDCFTTSSNPDALFEGTQTIIFDGPADQILASNGGDLHNIMVNKSGGRVSLSQPLNLFGSLKFNSATEFASNGNLTLISTSDGTGGNAMIGEILSGGSVTGDVSVQRFISGEGKIWRYISSPVSDATVADWQDDFPITGKFADPSTGPGINSSTPSLYYYGESNSGTELRLGWTAYPTSGTAASNNIIPGGGYSALMINGTNPTTLEVTGVINQGNFDFDVSFAGSGWNLLGNPYPATIDWSSTTGWVSSGLANAIYIRNNENGNSNSSVASFVDGIGTNGGTGFVATGQSFWVQAIAPNPSLQINERAKSGNVGAFFRKSRDNNWFRITLRNEAQFDETVIRFSGEATLGYDITKDAKKFTNGGINLSTFVDSQESMAINSLPMLTCSKQLNLKLARTKPGNYSLDFSGLVNLNLPYVFTLVDNYTDTITEVADSLVYSFEVLANKSSYEDRFVINVEIEEFDFTPEVVSSTTCSKESLITINNSLNGILYSISDQDSLIIDSILGNGNSLEFWIPPGVLRTGRNPITMNLESIECGTLVHREVINLELATFPEITEVSSGFNCAIGTVTLSASSNSNMDGSFFNWYEDSLSSDPIAVTETGSFTTPKLAETKAYFVTVVNSQGCESSKKEVLAEIIQWPPLEITEIGKDTLISNYPNGNLWFLDGEPIENGIGPLLVVSEPGLYGLEVSIKDCQSSAQLDLVTDVYDNEPTTEFVVFPNPVEDELNIDFLEYPTPRIKLSLTDMQGREIIKLNLKNSQKSLKLDFSHINRGVYMLKITKGGKEISKKVFKISSNFR